MLCVHNAHLKRTELAASWAALHLVYFKGVGVNLELGEALSDTLNKPSVKTAWKSLPLI